MDQHKALNESQSSVFERMQFYEIDAKNTKTQKNATNAIGKKRLPESRGIVVVKLSLRYSSVCFSISVKVIFYSFINRY